MLERRGEWYSTGRKKEAPFSPKTGTATRLRPAFSNRPAGAGRRPRLGGRPAPPRPLIVAHGPAAARRRHRPGRPERRRMAAAAFDPIFGRKRPGRRRGEGQVLLAER